MIEGVSGSTPQGLGIEVSSADELKTDFLKLLTTQLANQDPFDPMDNTQMVQQLATFSQLEQLEGVNSRLETSIQMTQSMNNTMMMDLVGKRVTVLGNEVEMAGGEPSRTLVRTVEPGTGQAKVYNADGELVRTVENLRFDPGFTEVRWDGKNDSGETLPDGDYTIEISAQNSTGGFLSVATFQSGLVDTIQFDNNFQTIIVNGAEYSPADIVEVGIPADRSSTGGDDGDADDPDGDGGGGGGRDDEGSGDPDVGELNFL